MGEQQRFTAEQARRREARRHGVRAGLIATGEALRLACNVNASSELSQVIVSAKTTSKVPIAITASGNGFSSGCALRAGAERCGCGQCGRRVSVCFTIHLEFSNRGHCEPACCTSANAI